jgi:hypothetical protein
MDLQECVNNYHSHFKDYPPSLMVSNKQIIGLWVMGNRYDTKTSLYGGYPHGYLDRIYQLFPKTDKTLHIFSGDVDDSDTDKVDLEMGIDAHTMSDVLENNFYDLILSDPPYSVEDCDHYGCCMIKRNVVFNQCFKIMKQDGILIWLDQVLPQYKKVEWDVVGRIGMVKSTNHRFRVITIFKKK